MENTKIGKKHLAPRLATAQLILVLGLMGIKWGGLYPDLQWLWVVSPLWIGAVIQMLAVFVVLALYKK
jgi:hypothetical protein